MLVRDTREVEALASMVWRLAPEESRLCQSALMWLAVNQVRHCQGRSLSEICDGLLAVGRGHLVRAAPPQPDHPGYDRLCKQAEAVLQAQVADPTFGACRVHRHDECPQWSRRLMPSALIGPFFFYPAGR